MNKENKNNLEDQSTEIKKEKELPVHNPLTADDKKITQEDVNSEQAFKEAQTERD